VPSNTCLVFLIRTMQLRESTKILAVDLRPKHVRFLLRCMSTQEAWALPSPAPSNTVVINARCSLRIDADQRVLVVAGLPVHHCRAEDKVAKESQICVLGLRSGVPGVSVLSGTILIA
jgi:hypothetical protein